MILPKLEGMKRIILKNIALSFFIAFLLVGNRYFNYVKHIFSSEGDTKRNNIHCNVSGYYGHLHVGWETVS